jgi:hypothetical protein
MQEWIIKAVYRLNETMKEWMSRQFIDWKKEWMTASRLTGMNANYLKTSENIEVISIIGGEKKAGRIMPNDE